MWGQPPPQQQMPPPQYAPPPSQQYAPPPQQYAPPPPHYAPPPQYGAQMAGGPAPGGDDVRSLWIGDLQYWMDENYLYNAFAPMGQQVASVKVIRNKQSGQSEGYGFIEFQSRAAAEYALANFNGRMMLNVDQLFKLNWASSSAGEKRAADEGSDHTIFVGDLAADVTDSMLEEAFKVHYPSVRGAKVVIDKVTGRTKGYGFVRFGDENEQTRAMTDMNGTMLSTRQMRLGPAANKKNMGTQQTYSTNGYQSSQGNDSESDPNNTTIFVGGLDSNVNEDHLKQVFAPYGEIGYVKIPVGKRCGFVQFTSRSSAEEAIRVLNGSQIGGQQVRLSWGRTPHQNKQVNPKNYPQAPQQDASQWNGNGNYYGYQQSYEASYYGAPNGQDPSAQNYYGYSGYSNYEQQQQPQQQEPLQQQPPPQQPPQQVLRLKPKSIISTFASSYATETHF
uniref:RRM domain-containing protein n=1 Tax=Oryza brachyantha TaxID=4533 RepID=J3MLC2_ORYBR